MDVARGMRRGYIDKGLVDPSPDRLQVRARLRQQRRGQLGLGGRRGDETAWAATPALPPPPQARSPRRPPPPLLHQPPPSWIRSRSPRTIRDQFIAGQGTIDLTALPGTVRGSWQTPKPSPGPPSQGPQPATPSPAGRPGGELLRLRRHGRAAEGAFGPAHGSDPQFVGQVGQQAGTKLTPWGNESHSLTTVNGNRSAHADGNAADIPSSGAELIRLGRAALVAAGMPPAQANKQTGACSTWAESKSSSTRTSAATTTTTCTSGCAADRQAARLAPSPLPLPLLRTRLWRRHTCR